MSMYVSICGESGGFGETALDQTGHVPCPRTTKSGTTSKCSPSQICSGRTCVKNLPQRPYTKPHHSTQPPK